MCLVDGTVIKRLNDGAEDSMECPRKKLNTELPCIAAIPFPGIYLKELKAGTDTHTCTPRWTAALSPMAERGKQPQCPISR